ncbi:MAG: SRPBCC domain-containing protein, partial [Niabella sp.]|nr:SRPBCC domain-containing protein [Niabella sp.]
MKNEDFTTSFVTTAAPLQVFSAINDVRGWWSENIEGRTDLPGSRFIYRDKYLTAEMYIAKLNPQRIVWEVADSYNTFFDHRTEWNGTRIIFEIAVQEGHTLVTFTHVGLIPQFECFNVCSNSWEFFITGSLKLLVSGKNSCFVFDAGQS